MTLQQVERRLATLTFAVAAFGIVAVSVFVASTLFAMALPLYSNGGSSEHDSLSR